MKHSFLVSLALLGACALSCKSTSGDAAMAMDEQAMMSKWMEFATPGAAHKVLDSKVGFWKFHVRMFNPNGTLAGESDGTSECKWIMDGRYLEDSTTGTAMGQPFLGRGLTGFDNMKRKYVGTWIDNMGTGVMTFEGTYDPSTKTMRSESQMPEFSAGHYVPSIATETFIDQDHWVMKAYMPNPDGKQYMHMQIDYTRSSR